MMTESKPTPRFYPFLLILFGLMLTSGLVAILLIGSTSRYMQDDYCYAALLRGNFWQQQVNAYLHETTFSGNRFSLTFFMGISELFGPTATRYVPAFMLLAWLDSLYFFIRQLPWLNHQDWVNRLEAFIVAEVLVLFTLGMAPNWVQVYFWRAGMFPYLAPLVTGSLLMALLAKSLPMGKYRWIWLTLVLITAFLTGGFSEIAVVAELAILGLGLCIMLLYKKGRKALILPFGLAILGCVAAMALIVLSPMNMLRLQRSYSESTPILQTLINSFQGGLTFYLATLYRSTLYYISALLIFTLLGWGINKRLDTSALPLKRLLLMAGGLILAAYLVTSAAMAPGFYAENSYPSDRAQIVPRFISLLLALGLGFLAGNACVGVKKRWLSSILFALLGAAGLLVIALWFNGMKLQFHPPTYPEMREWVRANQWISLVILVGSLLVSVLIVWKTGIRLSLSIWLVLLGIPALIMGARFLAEYPLMQQRAELWDGRDAVIRQQQAVGETQLVVPAMNSLTGILELSDYEGFWVNNCAALYYGVESISAVEPVLDPVQLSSP
ncbi:MAG: hypothetical protein C0410_08680 [Anaerolinea sp.]|nr:hypothetical protein [Anaerolinea sp.]